jgi:hypothetical protein
MKPQVQISVPPKEEGREGERKGGRERGREGGNHVRYEDYDEFPKCD